MTTGQIASSLPAGSEGALATLRLYRRAAAYLTAAAIHLSRNALLREPLSAGDLKPLPVDRSATAPAVNLAYAHLDRLVRARDRGCLLVAGPRDAGAAVLANLFLDGSLAEFYPELTCDAEGIEAFVRAFDWPGGLPGHLGPAIPGQVHAGGELGALATAFGAALDNPDLLVACMLDADDSPTGPSAASWTANRFLDPATSGAVLPIVDASAGAGGRGSFAGGIPDDDLLALYRGYGWEPVIVRGSADAAAASAADIDAALASALAAAADEIDGLQRRARNGERLLAPRWPVIVLRLTPDRPLPIMRNREDAARELEAWLRALRPAELFGDDGTPAEAIRGFCDLGEMRLGMSHHAIGGVLRAPLELPDAAIAAIPVARPGATVAEGLERVGQYLAEVLRRSANERNFRVVSPDPLDSSELGAIVEAGGRAYAWPAEAAGTGGTETDRGGMLPGGPVTPGGDVARDAHVTPDGRVVEGVSENVAERLTEGYLKTGRHAFFLSGEAFLQVAESQIGQFAAWLRASRDVPWRPPLASLNLLLMSDAWRPDRRRYSHESASIINSLLTRKGTVVRITLPPDANTLVETVARCLRSTGYVNLVVTTGRPLPQWLSMAAARAHATAGASIWRWASIDDGIDPDVVLASAGATATNEILAAADLLRHDVPELRVRVVNVMDLMRLDARGHPHGLSADAFEALFTLDRPVVFSFHGYPSAIHQLVSGRPNPSRFHVRGHSDEDLPTTPLGALIRSGQSRYQLAIEAIRRAGRQHAGSGAALDRYTLRIEEHSAHVAATGEDPEDIRAWRWPEA